MFKSHEILLGAAGHVTGEEGHVTSLTSWRAACDISARSFGLPTNYERPIVSIKIRVCIIGPIFFIADNR